MTGIPRRMEEPYSRVAITAPVKVNLALHVVGQRADGYHLLESLVAFSPDGDRITLEKAESDSFAVDGPFASSLGEAGDNLVLKARAALRAAYGDRIGPVAIRLAKRLPVAAGIGGGSADAAAALHGLMALWQVEEAPESLERMAVALGADVPMCLAGMRQKTALVAAGIGERLEMLSHFPALHLVLVNPGEAVSTPAVFAGLETRQNGPLVFDRQGLRSLDGVLAFLHGSRNDLYEPACRLAPALAPVLESLRRNGALFARMSGSGATCFGIYRSAAAAQAAAAAIRQASPGFFVLATTTFGKDDEHDD